MKNKILALAGATVMIAGVVSFTSADAQPRSARARLVTAHSVEIGTVDFTNAGGYTEVKVRLINAPGIDAFHGFHVHANNVVTATNGEGCIADPAMPSNTWFVSADGHYNPGGTTHSHHAGDLPVVYVNGDGSVETKFRIDTIDSSELIGKAVVLHAGPDNYANIPASGANGYTPNSITAIPTTNNTGNSGDRIACGVIGA